MKRFSLPQLLAAPAIAGLLLFSSVATAEAQVGGNPQRSDDQAGSLVGGLAGDFIGDFIGGSLGGIVSLLVLQHIFKLNEKMTAIENYTKQLNESNINEKLVKIENNVKQFNSSNLSEKVTNLESSLTTLNVSNMNEKMIKIENSIKRFNTLNMNEKVIIIEDVLKKLDTKNDNLLSTSNSLAFNINHLLDSVNAALNENRDLKNLLERRTKELRSRIDEISDEVRNSS